MAKSRPQQPKPTSAPQKNQAPEKLSLTDRLRTFLGAETDPKTGKPRRVSRKQRDDRRTRNLYVALGVLGVVSVLLLSGAAINEYFLKPRKVLATVQGEDITRRDYWKYQSHSLASQAIQYQQFAMLMQGQQQQQYLAMAQQAQAQLDEVWGSTDVDDASLSRMVDDKVILASVDSLGLSISDEQVDDYIANQFAAAEAPVSTPTPSPTLIAERAEWATQTAIALEGSPVPIDELAEVGSPVAAAENEATPASDEGQRSESPVAVASPSSAGSPVPASSPVAGTPEPTATIGPQDARATSTANFENYRDDILELSHMSVSDYRRLVAEPNLAREMVNAYFLEELGQSAEQVHARHILVGTQELADSLYAQLQEDPDLFEMLAQEASVDSSTAPNGGDLGWFPRGIMVPAFEEAAFSLPPGEISSPVQTEFGWHIIQVIEHDDDRALTDAQIQQASQAAAERWLESQYDQLEISSSVEPTPTQSISQFVPPADAPPVPTIAPEPKGSPIALPGASPVTSEGSPAANEPAQSSTSPQAATPASSPVASLAATPVASPISTPNASPEGGSSPESN